MQVQAKEVSQAAASVAQSAAAAAAAEDVRQLLYETEWQVTQAGVAHFLSTGPCLIKRRLQHEMVWGAGSPAAVQQRAGMMHASGMGPAASAAHSTARQAQVLQQIMGAPGEPGWPHV